MIKRVLLIFPITIMLTSGFADNNGNVDTTTPSPQQTQSDTTPADAATANAKNLFFCPPIKTLTKNPDPNQWNWTAPGGWQSYGISFVSQIQEFDGAQWIGSQVGQLTCIYRGPLQTDFPIKLIYHALTLEPQNGLWSKNLGGYRNCFSKQQNDCPFQVRLKPQQGNIYQQMEQFKSNQDGSAPQNPGY